MKLQVFIERPILSGVLSVVIILLGIIGLSQLPVEQFPEIAPPTIRVTATYTGANAETVQKAVIAPLEESINGVETSTMSLHRRTTAERQPSMSISAKVQTPTWRQ